MFVVPASAGVSPELQRVLIHARKRAGNTPAETGTTNENEDVIHPLKWELRTKTNRKRFINMYDWHKISEEKRCELLKKRKQRSLPWHSPPHFDSHGLFHLTAANYCHNIIIGKSLERLNCFSEIFFGYALRCR